MSMTFLRSDGSLSNKLSEVEEKSDRPNGPQVPARPDSERPGRGHAITRLPPTYDICIIVSYYLPT